MSPSEVEQKTASILRHQSQKDSPMFPGDDKREFWMRSKERNRNTAEELRDLGFSDYEAVECFVNLNDLLNYE
jgi:glucosamine-6-phosphate deaminase